MVEWVYALTMVWHAGLILLLLFHALRVRQAVVTLIAFDAVSVVFLSALVVLAAHRRDTLYLDIALVLAMLIFVQTVAAARLLERRNRR